MTRTPITVNAANRSDTPPSFANATLTTIDATLVTNGVSVTDFFSHSNPRVIITNTEASTKDITLRAGTMDQCVKSAIGNYTLNIPAGGQVVIDQIESARFLQSGGALHIDFETGHTGIIYATGTKRGIG